MSKVIGIYKITNILNNKFYIGSSGDIHVRWNQHINDLKKNLHINKRLQNAWNKYGEQNFKFEIIETLYSDTDLLLIEQKYLDNYKCYNKNVGYNIAKCASAPMRGKKHTKKSIQKQIINQTGERNWQFGKVRTEQHSRNLGLALGGLTKEQENDFISDYINLKIPIKELLKKYDISNTQVYRILKKYSEKTRKNVKISENIKKQILQDFANGLSRAEIRKKYNVKKTTLYYLTKNIP